MQKDILEQIRDAIEDLKNVDWEDPIVMAKMLSWTAMLEGILNDHSPKRTQRIQQGQVAPEASDLAAGAGR